MSDVSKENVTTTKEEGFPSRAFVIGLVLSLFVAIIWVTQMSAQITYSEVTLFGDIPPQFWSTVPFAIMIVLMSLVGILGSRFRLSTRELAVIYILTFTGWISPEFANWFYNQTWTIWGQAGGQLITSLIDTGKIPSFIAVTDRSLFETIFTGGPMPWAAITPPLLYWCSLALSEALLNVFLAWIFTNLLVERQGLTFPYADAGIELVRMNEPVSSAVSRPRILKNKVLWIGFLIACVLWGFNMIHAFNPLISRLPIEPYMDVGSPWGSGYTATAQLDLTSALKGAIVVLNFNPLLTAAFFFIPIDVLFTMWVSMIFFQWIVPAAGIALGVYPDISSAGGWSVWWAVGNDWQGAWWYITGYGLVQGIGLYILFFNWRYLKDVISSAIRKTSDNRFALTGFIVCTLIHLGLMIVAGALWWLIIITYLWHLFIWIGLIRMRAESPGLYGFWWQNWNNGYFAGVAGFQAGDPQAYITVNLYSNSQGPYGSHSFALGSPDIMAIGIRSKLNMKYVVLMVAITTIITAIFSAYFFAWFGYAGLRNPTAALPGGWQVDLGWIIWSQGYTLKISNLPITYVPYVIGVILAVVTMWLRATLAWFPLNPIGMVMGCIYMWPWVFTAPLLAWICKYIIFKTGGSTLYQRIMPFCIGFLGGYAFIKILSWPLIYAAMGPSVPPPV